MCGLAGIYGKINNEHLLSLQKMSEAIQHRGPDAEGTFSDAQVALAHRRLSIIDLSDNANQPFKVADLPYVLVFNGEIYNYKALKAALGTSFQTDSDTEVLLRAFHAWGPDCVKQLQGMFAFAIYNTDTHELFVARDPLGIKPFYYCYCNGLFVFASEMRALLKSHLFEPRLQSQALHSFLRYGFVPEPYTFIEGLMQLPAAHAGFVKAAEIELKAYWTVDVNQVQTQTELSDLKTLLASAVKKRMVADVPVAAFLSGGIDSSAVVSLMSTDEEAKISTYTVALDEQSLNEAEYAQTMADIYHTEHHCLRLKAQAVLKAFDGFFDAMDAPTVDGMNVYLITQQVAQKGVKVVMSGVGGDELFAGYPGFKQWHQLKPWRKVLSVLGFKYCLKALMKLSQHKVLLQLHTWLTQADAPSLNAFYAAKRSLFTEQFLAAMLLQPVGPFALNTKGLNESESAVSDYSLLELNNYTREVLLKDMDQMGMAFGVELREPLLDLQLLERVLKTSDNTKLKGDTNKPLLVKAMGDFMPMSLIKRPKKGFTLDWDQWLRNDLKPLMDEAVKALSQTHLFNPKSLEALQQKYQAKHPSVNWVQVWSLVVLHQWFKRHLPELFSH